VNFYRKQAAQAFGEVLRTARDAKGMSQEELADLGDFDRTYPSLLERGKRSPTIVVIVRLAIALDIDPAVLFANAWSRLRETALAEKTNIKAQPTKRHP